MDRRRSVSSRRNDFRAFSPFVIKFSSYQGSLVRDRAYTIRVNSDRCASSQLHYAALHGAGGMLVLAPRQDAVHRKTAAAGDHRQTTGRASDILPRLQQRRRIPVSARQSRDAKG